MVYYDQLNRAITLRSMPKRIVSLVPSQTELLHSLGLESEVVGITKFCVRPQEWFHKKVRIGGPKKLDMNLIDQLCPDLIIGNKEENERGQLEELMHRYPVWISDVSSLSGALEMIRALGEITATGRRSQVIEAEIEAEFGQLRQEAEVLFENGPCPSAAYFIWRNPWMVAAKNTFIDAMLQCCGLDNCFYDKTRYPEVSLAQVKQSGCNLILLSSEPFPFQSKHAMEIQQQLPDAQIIFVDGEMFCWYGSRLLGAPSYFKKILKQISLLS